VCRANGNEATRYAEESGLKSTSLFFSRGTMAKPKIRAGTEADFFASGKRIAQQIDRGERPQASSLITSEDPARASCDATQYLTDDERIRHYLAATFEGGNPAEIQSAIADCVKAKGTKAIARVVGLKGKALKEALSDPCVPYALVASIVEALGLRLTVEQRSKPPQRLKDSRNDWAWLKDVTGPLDADFERGTRE
jgi:probable addiction module antidote protein